MLGVGWERTGSPNPGGMPKHTRQEQGSPHIGQWKGSLKERYSNTKATVEHNTMGKGWVREEIKKKQKKKPKNEAKWGLP